jgi:radical SAM enzyme (rSAM/lipoprotein system)
MSADKIPLRTRLGLELFRKYRRDEVQRHRLNYLFWECTLRCNLSCRHCGSDCRHDAAQKDMPLADFLRVLDSIRPHVDPHKTMIVVTGGEPLMRNDLERCGQAFYEREFPWGFVTNGLALMPQRLDRLIDSGLRAVTVSLDGFEPEHNRMRGHPKSFANAVAAIRTLIGRQEHLIFDVVTCVSSHTFGELERLKEFLIDLGVKRWRVFTVFPHGRAAENSDLQLSPAQFRGLFEFIRKTRKEGRIRLDYGCEGFLGSFEGEVRDSFFFCRAGVTTASVLADGAIGACPSIRSDYTQGNIYTDDFMEVWNDRYAVYRDRSWAKKDDCADCRHFRYCEGSGMHLRDEDGRLQFCHLKRIREGEKP